MTGTNVLGWAILLWSAVGYGIALWVYYMVTRAAVRDGIRQAARPEYLKPPPVYYG